MRVVSRGCDGVDPVVMSPERIFDIRRCWRAPDQHYPNEVERRRMTHKDNFPVILRVAGVVIEFLFSIGSYRS